MNTVLHIGYPKTATTSIQRNFLSQLPNTNLIGELPDRLGSVLDFKMSPFGVQYEKLMEQETNVLASIKHEQTCLSDEQILGSSRRVSEQRFIARRLQGLFPDSQILIVVRNQEDILKSIYRSNIHTSLSTLGVNLMISEHLISERIIEFNEWLSLLFSEPMETWAGLLMYSKIISEYMEIFGQDRVHVIPYEVIKRDPESLDKTMKHLFPQSFERFSVAMNGKRHRERRAVSRPISLRRLLSMKRRFWQKNKNIIINPESLRFAHNNRERLHELYSNSNSKTANISGYDLSSFGYVVE